MASTRATQCVVDSCDTAGRTVPWNPSATGRALLVLIVLAAAVTASAREPTEWPFCQPVPHAPPVVTASERVANPIDAFVLQKLEWAGLTLSPEASKRTLVRRLYFNLIGLPATPEQVEAFVNSSDPTAYELVDSLLADPRYDERWARVWLDLARYADTAGYEGDPDLPHAWRYRDYVIDSLNQDKPYHDFVKEQIAGDEFEAIRGAGELPAANPEREESVLRALALEFIPWSSEKQPVMLGALRTLACFVDNGQASRRERQAGG